MSDEEAKTKRTWTMKDLVARSNFVERCFALRSRIQPDVAFPPTLTSEHEAEVDDLIATYYDRDGNAAGGSLHVVLDDSNWRDDSIRFCIDFARDRGDIEGQALAILLLVLPWEERLRHACSCCVDELRLEGP